MLAPSRVRPQRAQTESQKQAVVQAQSIAAPVAGMVTNEALPNARSAIILENMWPTSDGVEPRRGCASQCSVPDPVVTLFQHTASGTYVAATASGLYTFTGASVGALTAAVSGLTSGAWSTYEVQNSGGSFLLCVNGADHMRRFDGSAWLTITGTGTGAITGVDTDDLSYIWGHRNRVFAIKSGTLSAYYLGVNSIAGAATELPLAAVFRKGGALLMGGTWSSDSGSGMDDRCVFVTTTGEIAVFAGSDPGDLNNWSLQGIYDVGAPLGRFASETIGGDVVFLTRDGIIPLSAVVSKDPSQLSAAAVSAAIGPTMRAATDYVVGDWRLAKWDIGGMLIAAPMVSSDLPVKIFAANLVTGAWSMVTGWEASDIRGLGAALYFGDRSGSIFRAWTGGNDDGRPFIARAMMAPDPLGSPSGTKTVGTMQAVFRARAMVTYTMGVAINYADDFGAPPMISSSPADEELSEWDVAEWDVSSWGSDVFKYTTVSGWRGVNAVGDAFSPWVQILCDSPGWVNAKLQRFDLTYSAGGVQL